MIRYALSCDNDHAFESWFQSAEAFDRLTAAGHVSCALCASPRVSKSLMAPSVRPARKADASGRASAQPDTVTAPAPARAAAAPSLAVPSTPLEMAVAKLRAEIEAKSEYVGLNFAAEARAIHDGDAPGRAIYGEAHHDDARRLLEDGIAVAPLPFMPLRRVN